MEIKIGQVYRRKANGIMYTVEDISPKFISLREVERKASPPGGTLCMMSRKFQFAENMLASAYELVQEE